MEYLPYDEAYVDALEDMIDYLNKKISVEREARRTVDTFPHVLP